jgi:hypothetical protein
MRVIIIEDEIPAANRLVKMLQSISDEIDVIKKLIAWRQSQVSSVR